MRITKRLVKLAVLLFCGALVLGPGDSSSNDGDFYVIASASPWVRNGNNIYYNKGYVGVGITDPHYLFHIFTPSELVPMRIQADASGASAIQAVANYGVAVSGYTVTGKGVLGNAQGGAIGVQGECTGYGAGVYGYNTANGPGVRGNSLASNGVFGETSSTNEIDAGVYGVSHNHYASGVLGVTHSSTGYGVIARNDSINGGFALLSDGYFACNGNTHISGGCVVGNNLVVYGDKAAIVPTSQGDRKLYCQESPEVWFEDFGEGKLVGGMAHIDLDPLFLETVTISDQHPMKVFIQLNDDCNGVYVQRQATGFEVVELGGGNSGAQFTYRVVAKRKGFETARLETAGDSTKQIAKSKTQDK